MRHTDTLIVGAGPIGLELAVALKQAGVDYEHVDAGQIGQTIAGYPRQARFFSSPERIAIAGVPLNTVDGSKATREQYLTYLRGVVQQYDLQVRTYQRVVGIDRDAAGSAFTVHTRRGGHVSELFLCQHLVLAIGDMHHPRLLHIPGEDLPHVSHTFEEPHAYFKKKLLIVGGRNSAVEAAIRCHRAGAQVTMSYRRQELDSKSIKYWLMPEIESLCKDKHICYLPQTTPTGIEPDVVHLAETDAEGKPTDTQQSVEADFVLLLTGYRMDPALFDMAGIDTTQPNRAPLLDEATMETSVSRLYVAGTAVAGSQERTKLFIENSHVHVRRIFKAITGQDVPDRFINTAVDKIRLPES